MLRSFLVLAFLSMPALAVQFVVQAPCASAPWLNVAVNAMPGRSVGRVTVDTLTQAHLPFSGSEAGVKSIRGTVTGDAALEVISDKEMRAYGWCFLVNGKQSSAMPDKTPIYSSSDKVTWFFGYAHYLNGKWVEMCVPTHVRRPRFICGGY